MRPIGMGSIPGMTRRIRCSGVGFLGSRSSETGVAVVLDLRVNSRDFGDLGLEKWAYILSMKKAPSKLPTLSPKAAEM
jgi:hypothetical protein